ncbi:MAG TPA: signal peptidase II [Bdellovibrionales bacterium]|nr:signal peptidase II [Bdellovibrionales bacterium]
MNLDRKYLVLATITGFLVAFDQLTKIYVHSSFILGESVPVIPGIFHFTYVRNIGAAFGLFREMPEIFRQIFFLSMPPIAMGIILYMLRSVPNTDRWQVFALSLIFGGAIGNYIDRLRFGYVIDFLDVHYKDVWSYPAFNIADSGIVIGVILLLLMMTKRDMATTKSKKK